MNVDKEFYEIYSDELKKALLDDNINRLIVYGDDGEKVEYRRIENGKCKYCPWCGAEMRIP